MNSRHPGPRCVWKVGSGARLLPPLCRDPVDQLESSETSIFDDPSVDFGHFACGVPPCEPLGELWESPGSFGASGGALGGLWEGLGELLESFGAPLGRL